MSSRYFSYIRVSTIRQGQTGTSLDEQRSAIRNYAQRWGLPIVQEFEERETAAKLGRPVFLKMLNLLRQHRATGVIIHKIDRSARNLRDWAELGEMIDSGIDVHFANENLDLESRGGRLSADIQAVVAADYIRNLRDEVKKGFYGRLKQGLYPMPAPVGYVNKGPGEPKDIDPIQGPLVRRAHELYASGRWAINVLVDEMYSLGLRNQSGGKVTRNGMSRLLHNPFYTGLIRLRKNSELFTGRHQPLIPQVLFDRVQAVIAGKNVKGPLRHEFVFRRMSHCGVCAATLIGETKKGHVYYRCQNSKCSERSVREEELVESLTSILTQMRFSDSENVFLKREIMKRYDARASDRERALQSIALQLNQMKTRLSALTDAYLDGVLDEHIFREKKNALVLVEQSLNDRKTNLDHDLAAGVKKVEEILGLANDAYLSWKLANAREKRDLVETLTSDITVIDKKVSIKLKIPFQRVVERERARHGRPLRAAARTLSALVSQLFSYVTSRNENDEVGQRYKPVAITPHRLKLAFRRANTNDTDRRAA
jgi:site-specific DNA recombinase